MVRLSKETIERIESAGPGDIIMLQPGETTGDVARFLRGDHFIVEPEPSWWQRLASRLRAWTS